LAADLMLIWVFAIVDVAIPLDDDFALLLQLVVRYPLQEPHIRSAIVE
jgi:hypothetical protein